jgi:far upstream element-binding protein
MQQEKNSRPGGGRPRDDNQYNQQPTFSQSNQQPLGQRNTQTQPPPAASADPYAAYGGYENYVALWYSSQMQQQQQAQQNPQGPPPP